MTDLSRFTDKIKIFFDKIKVLNTAESKTFPLVFHFAKSAFNREPATVTFQH